MILRPNSSVTVVQWDSTNADTLGDLVKYMYPVQRGVLISGSIFGTQQGVFNTEVYIYFRDVLYEGLHRIYMYMCNRNNLVTLHYFVHMSCFTDPYKLNRHLH